MFGVLRCDKDRYKSVVAGVTFMSRQIVTASETQKTCRVVHAGFMDVRFFNCKSYFPTAYIDTKRN